MIMAHLPPAPTIMVQNKQLVLITVQNQLMYRDNINMNTISFNGKRAGDGLQETPIWALLQRLLQPQVIMLIVFI
ncbi:hypothetical protein ETR_00460 [Erwinia tracheiphila PSU-1]|nr:hypothetical protein ETR_00460 [Erwinia tracheiphila PSU-1]